MDRRAALALLGSTLALGGCLSDAPGATGPRNPPDEETRTATPAPATPEPRRLYVESYDFDSTEDGSLRVFGTVRTDLGEAVTGVVRAGIFYADQQAIQDTEITVPADGSREFEFIFDVAFDTFAEDGEVFVQADPDGE